MIQALIAAGALLAAAGQDAPLSPQAIAAMPSEEVARRILPAEQAGAVVKHKVIADSLLGQFSAVELYEATEPVAGDVCRRRVHYVAAQSIARIRAGDPAEPAVPKLQLALARDCATLTDTDFAWVQPARVEAEAIALLRWLAALQQRRDLSGITFDCSDEMKGDACARGPEATFRALPLGKAYIIEPLDNRDPARGWRLSIMPTGPGQLFYDTRITSDATGRTRIAMRWMVPAPF